MDRLLELSTYVIEAFNTANDCAYGKATPDAMKPFLLHGRICASVSHIALEICPQFCWSFVESWFSSVLPELLQICKTF